ncbi:MAG: D-alanyl-D-alanine carboxypeptidase/D-alanyl-D-alanine-endopeptidase [Myxococcota bacterium]
MTAPRIALGSVSFVGALGVLLAEAFASEVAVADQAIREQLQEILQAPQLSSAATGVHVRSVKTGRVLFDHRGHDLFNPASNMKLLTTAASLEVLGPSYQFRTEVRRDPVVVDGVVRGNLYVVGRGDPTLTTETLFGLVNEVALRGIREVTGDLVADDSFFDDVREGPGWEEETGDPAYAAPIGAFSVNFNTFVVRVVPGDSVGAPARALIWPDIDLIRAVVDATTRPPRTPTRLWAGTSVPRQDHIHVTIRGAIAMDRTDGVLVRRRVHNPTRHGAEMMRRLLEMRGIKIGGRIREGTAPRTSTFVVAHDSPSLGDIVGQLNKYSNNFVAEQILKTLGAEIHDPPGSWQSGIRVVETFLRDLGFSDAQFRLKNGSGLNDTNRVSPALITELLRMMYRRFEVRPEFVASLAVAGHSGTIEKRFGDTIAETRLRAKTGSLTGVSALSGYVATQDDDVLAFSIMMNGYRGRARSMWQVQDAIGVALASHGQPEELASPHVDPSSQSTAIR